MSPTMRWIAETDFYPIFAVLPITTLLDPPLQNMLVYHHVNAL